MSKRAIAAFLKQVAEDPNLQAALVEFAARHGFKFTPRDLRDVDLVTLSGSIRAVSHRRILGRTALSNLGATESPERRVALRAGGTGQSAAHITATSSGQTVTHFCSLATHAQR
jgi:hypothetical protein